MDAAAGINRYELMIAWGEHASIEPSESEAFDRIEAFHQEHQDWIFGIFSYDLKNSLENLSSRNNLYTGSPSSAFFVPEHLLVVDKSGEAFWMSHSWDAEQLLRFMERELPKKEPLFTSKPNFVHRIKKEEYVQKVEYILDQIREGNVYELNYCHEFYAQPAGLQNPLGLYEQLKKVSPAPFSSYFRYADHCMTGSSPERFLTRNGDILYSQPIKGTAPRRKDPSEDAQEIEKLRSSEKERAENVMIVDLVRNDLARSCRTGSIRVKELFGIYTFPRVHQMISTIEGKEESGLPLLTSFKNAFPMGSMTGAPKIAAMQLIDTLEDSARGWYSGAFGYIDPKGNFDFNVVIRSYIYNAATDYLSVMAGGAITIDSDPVQEYEESMLKAEVLLGGNLDKLQTKPKF